MKYAIILSLLFFSISGCELLNVGNEVTQSSPDGNIELTFSAYEGIPMYAINYNNNPLLLPSGLGFDIQGQKTLDNDLSIIDVKKSIHDETWEQPWGEERFIRNHYNQLHIALRETLEPNRRINIVFRIFNDGVAFRYEFPEQATLGPVIIMDEKTEFRFNNDGRSWWIPAYKSGRYEQLYQTSAINDMDTVHTPMTIEMDNGPIVSLHEANLVDYASYTLYPSDNNTLKTDLVPWSDGTKVKQKTPFNTPWRTIQIAENAADLITNYMILNLNDPNKLGDVSWVKPTKYVGIWWAIHVRLLTFQQGERHGATTERAKRYIDFAEENGIEEVLVEGWNEGWEFGWWLSYGQNMDFTTPTPDFDLFDVQEYALERGITLMGYHETCANPENYLFQIDSAFALYKNLGYRNVKIGQVGDKLNGVEWHHGQFGVNYYNYVIRKAAEYQLGVNFHEPIKPSGERRTYPNMLTSEGARGQEFNAWDREGGNPPAHNSILPFTRLLGGPMDFTPGIFDLSIPSMPNNQVLSTLTHQLALFITMYSPLQMAADLYENYQGHKAFQFIRDVPVDWETTRAINGSIGDYVTLARKDRNSPDWYLGSITNEQEREFTISLDFLVPQAKYEAQIYADAEDAHYKHNAAAYRIIVKPVDATSTLTLKLAQGGGVAVRFRRLQN